MNDLENIFMNLLNLYNNSDENDKSFNCELIQTFRKQFYKTSVTLFDSGIDIQRFVPFEIKLEDRNNKKQYIEKPNKISYKEDKIKIIKKLKIKTKDKIDNSESGYGLTQLEHKNLTVENIENNEKNIKVFEEKEELERIKKEKKKEIKKNENFEKKENKYNINKQQILDNEQNEQNDLENTNNAPFEFIQFDLNIFNYEDKKKENDQKIEINNNENKRIILSLNDKNENDSQSGKTERQNLKISLDEYKFNEDIIIRLLKERIKEIEEMKINNEEIPKLQIKNPLIGQGDFSDYKPISTNFKIKEIYTKGLFLAQRIIKELSEVNVPFNDISVNLIIDCSGFIEPQNKLKEFLLICGIINTFYLTNISYCITMSGDSQFHFIVKNFDTNHSMEVIQKIFECLFIKRFITKTVNSLEYAFRNTNPNSIYRTFLYFSNGLDEDFILEEEWKKLFNNYNNNFLKNSYGFFFITSHNLFENHKDDYLKITQIWEKFETEMKNENINLNIYSYTDDFNDNSISIIYENIAKNLSELLKRPLNDGLVTSIDEFIYVDPIFNLEKLKPLKDIKIFNDNMEFNIQDNINEIFINKNTELLKRIVPKNIKPNLNSYKNNISKITKYEIKDKNIKNSIVEFTKKYFLNSEKIGHNKKELIFKPNKASQKVLSTTGNEFDIPALIMNLLNPSLEPMIYLEEKGGLIKNYGVSIIIDSNRRIFNPLCIAHSMQILRSLLSFLMFIDLPSLDIVIATIDNPVVLCSAVPSMQALKIKSNLWESLLSILSIPSLKTDLCSAIECITNIKKSKYNDSTNYLFILTDGLYQEKEYPKIIRSVYNSVKWGINIFGIGVGIYPCRIEKLFPQSIYVNSPNSLIKALASFFGDLCPGAQKKIIFHPKVEENHSIKIENSINYLLKESKNCLYPEIKKKLSNILLELDAFKLLSDEQSNPIDLGNGLKGNPLGSNKVLLRKNALKGYKVLIVMLWSKVLNPEEYQYVHKDYLYKGNENSSKCLKDVFDFYGIDMIVVENYRNAIEELTKKDKDSKCPYYACWIINGPPYEDLPDNSKEAFLFGQFLEVLHLFRNNGGALIFLAEGWELHYQVNEYLKYAGFNNFKIIGDDSTLGTKEHKGGKMLDGNDSDIIGKQSFTKNIKSNWGTQRFRLDHNLFRMFEGDTISYADTDDDNKLYPFKKFAVDSEGGVSILVYPSEKSEGDIVIDCGFTKLFKNMNEDDSAFRFFQNIAAWSARTQYHVVIENMDFIKWRPNAIEFKINEDKKWNKFKKKNYTKNMQVDLSKMKTIFAFDNSGSIYFRSKLYFEVVKDIIINQFKKEDICFVWSDCIKEKSYEEIEQWIEDKSTPGDDTCPHYIVEEANKKEEMREHLLIVTDGRIDEEEIELCDKMMKQYDINFKYVTVYIIGEGDLSVGTPFSRNSPNKTIHITDDKKEEIYVNFTHKDLIIFDNLEKISSYNEFKNNFDSLKRVIKAKVLGKNGDIIIKNKLEIIESTIMKTINENEKNDFFEYINTLKEYATNGIHDFKFGTAGIKE